VFSLPVALLLAVAGPPAPTADVTGGTVRGSLSASGAVFKGIPFAAPPVGELRWREPQPVKPWHGLRDATHYSAACMQIPIGTGVFLAPLAHRYGANLATPRWDISEDCLYLNIWTPPRPAKEPLPVMLFLHGGSNRIGSGNETAYDGTNLARHGVIVVTVNYRLGVLGFFAHPELTRESPHHASGNYGLLDQIAALRWVRENIARFGGDPMRVTLFGESAGAIDIGMLMCSRLAGGLFHRAIVESGPVLGIAYAHTQRQAERFGERVAAGKNLQQLRSMPAEAVLAAAAQVIRQEPNPEFVLDGWVLQQSPQQIFADGTELPVSLMIGNNGREASVFRGAANSPAATASENAKKTLRISYGGMASMAMAMYYLDFKMGRQAAADDWLNDALMTCPSAGMAALNRTAGRRSYVYQFRRSIPGKGQDSLGSFHSLELPYVFDTFHDPAWNWLPFQNVDAGLSGVIEGYWTNFARTGDPNGPGLPLWRPFTLDSTEYMEFGSDARAVSRQGVRPTWCSLDVAKLKRRLLENQ